MYIVRCIEKIRKGSKITGYKIAEENGRLTRNVSPEDLKNMILTKQVKCINLKLTKDFRLIDKSEDVYYAKQNDRIGTIYTICNTELIRCIKDKVKNPFELNIELKRYGRPETLIKADEIGLSVMLIIKVDRAELVDMNTNEEATPLDISIPLKRKQVEEWIVNFINHITTRGKKRKK